MNEIPRIAWVVGIASLCAIALWLFWAFETRRFGRIVRDRYSDTLQAEFPQNEWSGRDTREALRLLARAESRLDQLISDDPELRRSAIIRRRVVVAASILSALPLLYLAMYLDALASD